MIYCLRMVYLWFIAIRCKFNTQYYLFSSSFTFVRSHKLVKTHYNSPQNTFAHTRLIILNRLSLICDHGDVKKHQHWKIPRLHDIHMTIWNLSHFSLSRWVTVSLLYVITPFALQGRSQYEVVTMWALPFNC